MNKYEKLRIKINQFITPKALFGLWAAVDTTWLALVDTVWSDFSNANFKAFILIQVSFLLIFLSIEKPSITDFLSSVVETSFTPNITDETKMEMVKESIGQHLNFWEFLSYRNLLKQKKKSNKFKSLPKRKKWSIKRKLNKI